jgi:hypothetical protein
MMLRLSDAHYAKGVLQKMGGEKSGAENQLEKRAMIKVLRLKRLLIMSINWQHFDGFGNFISWFNLFVRSYRVVQVP